MCPMYSYVLYYNIEKSGLNAVFAYLLVFFIEISLILPTIKYRKIKIHLIVSSMTKDKNRGGSWIFESQHRQT